MSTPNPDDYFGSPKGEATAKPKKEALAQPG